MERIAIGDVEPDSVGDADRRSLAGPLDASHVAINHYRLAPGDRGSGLHAHLDQEEVFVVVDGEATVETVSGEVVSRRARRSGSPPASSTPAHSPPTSGRPSWQSAPPATPRNCGSRSRVPTTATAPGGRRWPG